MTAITSTDRPGGPVPAADAGPGPAHGVLSSVRFRLGVVLASFPVFAAWLAVMDKSSTWRDVLVCLMAAPVIYRKGIFVLVRYVVELFSSPDGLDYGQLAALVFHIPAAIALHGGFLLPRRRRALLCGTAAYLAGWIFTVVAVAWGDIAIQYRKSGDSGAGGFVPVRIEARPFRVSGTNAVQRPGPAGPAARGEGRETPG